MIAPTREDSFAAEFSDRLGGPLGDHPRPARWWTPTRVVLATLTVMFALSFAHNAPCMVMNWGDAKLRSEAMCYSDVPYLYTSRGFAEQHWPYSGGDRYPALEYPVGVSYFAWGASLFTSVAPQGPPESVRAATPIQGLWGLVGMTDETNEYFVVTAALLFGCALLAAWFLTRADRRRPWDAMLFALSPALFAAGLINWDLLAVAFVAGVLWAWGNKRPWLVGVFIGLGTAAKLYPLFLLGAVLVFAIRERKSGGMPLFTRALGGAAVAWTLAQVPAWASGHWSTWTYFWTFNSDRGADLGSLWLLFQHLGWTVSAAGINGAMWVLLLALFAGVLEVGLRSRRTPTLAQLGYLVVLAFLLVNKVYSPQYVLWLLPLAILARPRWRDLLIWQACELFYYVAVWWYLADFLELSRGGQNAPYDIAIAMRVLGELYFAVQILRDLGRSEDLDPVEGRRRMAYAS